MTKKQQRSLWSQLPQWAWKQGLRTNVDFAQHPDSASAPAASQRQLPEHCSDIKTAQVITSRVEYPDSTDMHKPVLDIDFPAQLVPSTTPGHFHLYLDKELTQDKYFALLRALAAAGIIEPGYRDASIARGYTSVRLPWVRKEEQEPAPAPAAAPAAPAPQTAAQTVTARLREMQAQDPIIQNLRQAYGDHGRVSVAPAPQPFPIESRVRYNEERRRFEGGGMYVTDERLARANTTLSTTLHNAPPVDGAIWRNATRLYGQPINAGVELGESLIAEANQQVRDAIRRLPDPWNPPATAGQESWQALVEQHRTGPAPLRSTRPTSSDPDSPAYQHPSARRRTPSPSIIDEVAHSADVRQQLMEAEARIARQETIDRDRQRQQGIRSPRTAPFNYSWTAADDTRSPEDARISVSWTEPNSDPLGDIIEFRDRIAAAPPIAPSVADPNVPF